jgi:hypothetical protein
MGAGAKIEAIEDGRITMTVSATTGAIDANSGSRSFGIRRGKINESSIDWLAGFAAR